MHIYRIGRRSSGMSGEERPEVSIEVQLRQGVRVRVTGRGGAESLADALRMGIEAARGAMEAIERVSRGGERRFPDDLIPKIGELHHKELSLLLLYFEGPIGRDQINQRSREIGKEIPRTWLDKNFYTEMKGLFVAEAGPEGAKLYRPSDLGKREAESLLSQLRGGG